MKHVKLFLSFAAATVLLLNIGACKKSSSNHTTTCGGTICNKPLVAGETAGTTPSGIIGVHTLTYYESKTGAPFANGDQAVFELTTDNKMIVTYKANCVTIENPRKSSPVEVTFPDNCKFNVSFSASATTTGGLNEVNVNQIGGVFYGQFR